VSKNLVRLALDVALAVTFSLLFNMLVFGGLMFHETAGLAIGVGFILHKLLGWKWIRQVTLRLLRRQVSWRTGFVYLVDLLLLLGIGYILFSGLVISRVLVPYLLRPRSSFVYVNTHKSISFIALALAGIHLGLHWDWVVGIGKRMLGIGRTGRAAGYLAHALALLALAGGLYAMNSVHYFAVLRTLLTGDNIRQILRPRPPDLVPVVATYLGVMAVFAIITFYADKLLSHRLAR
jgi:hypothetical protein